MTNGCTWSAFADRSDAAFAWSAVTLEIGMWRQTVLMRGNHDTIPAVMYSVALSWGVLTVRSTDFLYRIVLYEVHSSSVLLTS